MNGEEDDEGAMWRTARRGGGVLELRQERVGGKSG